MTAAEKDEEYGPLWMLALSSGLRRGELLGLRWSAVDLTTTIARIEIGVQRAPATKRWHIGPLKTAGSRREIALIPQVIDALRAHQRRQKEARLKAGRPWNANGFGFQGEDGEFLSPETLAYRHSKLIKTHKLAPHRFHDLRHTCATLLIKHGESIPAVSRQLGHGSARMTLERYAHVLPDQRHSVASRMGKLLAG
jgi:integrase